MKNMKIKIKELTEGKKLSDKERKEILQENLLLKKISKNETESLTSSKKKLYSIAIIAVLSIAVIFCRVYVLCYRKY
jgi:hypothetical protein